MDENSNFRILVLDDEPLMLKLHAKILQGLGYGGVVAEVDARKALSDIDKTGQAPDLILLDLRMPGMDGVEFIRELSTRQFEGRILLVSNEQDRVLESVAKLARARKVRVLGQMEKPLNAQQLEVLINLWRPAAGTGRIDWKRTYTGDDVTEAVRARQLTLFYQPKIRIKTGEIVGVEALSRWWHPKHGLVLPDQFIRVAEEIGLIRDLTRAAFTLAVKHMSEWRTQGLTPRVAINVSVDALSDLDFAEFAERQATEASIPTRSFIIEVTEGRLVRELQDALEVLIRLHLNGFELSIDDFGTGYSSLAQLRDIPFGELKIDRSFVHRVSFDETLRTMYNTCLGLSKQLRMTSVAEGVEDERDWNYIRQTDCDLAQGYYIAKPMSAEALPKWWKAWEEQRPLRFGN